MIRGLEITSEVADGPQSVIEQQVRHGVAIRMALIHRALVSEEPGLKTPAALDAALQRDVYQQPALIPASPWLDVTPPASPKLNVSPWKKTMTIRWENGAGEPARWWVLQCRSFGVWTTEIFPANVSSRYGDNFQPDAIVIRAVDRTGNLSSPAVWTATRPGSQRQLSGEDADFIESLWHKGGHSIRHQYGCGDLGAVLEKCHRSRNRFCRGHSSGQRELRAGGYLGI